jgi:peptidoglycan/xylan/chitin deacetylase (PgdA/CDA1 family)
MLNTDRYKAVTAQLLARTFALKALDTLNRRRGGVILVFHEISALQLSSHLACLSDRYRFVSLAEFIDRLEKGKTTAGLAVITFDDGYQQVIECAAELAQLQGWPMTFFLPTRYLDTREPDWYQELKPLLAQTSRAEVTIDGIDLSLGDQAGTDAAFRRLDQRFKHASSRKEVDLLLGETRSALSGAEQGNLSLSEPISWARVRELATRPEISFESHSVNHLAVSRLTKGEVIAEMDHSRARIEEMTGRAVQHFCYPYGDRADIGDIAPAIARSRFRSAVTMLRGRCHQNANLFMLPRVPLYEGDSEHTVALKVGVA